MKLEHYLITVPVPGGYLHAYVMVAKNDRDALMRVADELLTISEQQDPPGLPIVLQTHLTTGWKTVRKIIADSGYQDAVNLWKSATTFHQTAWFMAEEHPDTEKLMALH
jgi:hypothetical protein